MKTRQLHNDNKHYDKTTGIIVFLDMKYDKIFSGVDIYIVNSILFYSTKICPMNIYKWTTFFIINFKLQSTMATGKK